MEEAQKGLIQGSTSLGCQPMEKLPSEEQVLIALRSVVTYPIVEITPETPLKKIGNPSTIDTFMRDTGIQLGISFERYTSSSDETREVVRDVLKAIRNQWAAERLRNSQHHHPHHNQSTRYEESW